MFYAPAKLLFRKKNIHSGPVGLGDMRGCGQGCLFDYELFTETDAADLSDSMRKYLWYQADTHRTWTHLPAGASGPMSRTPWGKGAKPIDQFPVPLIDFFAGFKALNPCLHCDSLGRGTLCAITLWLKNVDTSEKSHTIKFWVWVIIISFTPGAITHSLLIQFACTCTGITKSQAAAGGLHLYARCPEGLRTHPRPSGNIISLPLFTQHFTCSVSKCGSLICKRLIIMLQAKRDKDLKVWFTPKNSNYPTFR